MLDKQDGACRICGLTEKAHVEQYGCKLAIDHDHKDGSVRGLLCSRCNRGLGLFGDDPTLLIRAADYISRHKKSNSEKIGS